MSFPGAYSYVYFSYPSLSSLITTATNVALLVHSDDSQETEKMLPIAALLNPLYEVPILTNNESGNLQHHDIPYNGEQPFPSNSKEFPCSEPGCRQTFKTKKRLKQHAVVHNKKRPYQCSEPGCGQTFKRKGGLTQHAAVHTEERLYRCSEPGCGRTFKRKSELPQHAIMHTEERPYLCSDCGKPFKLPRGLKRHAITCAFKADARALEQIHDKCMLVGDIASRNFLLDSDLSVKIRDFSEASILPLGSAMETVDDNGFSIQTDIGISLAYRRA
jgi:DNA-directed RNA polymerase subunit RPC12/RpoP